MSEMKLPATELRFSLALGTGMLIQAAVALIWAGAAGERLNQLERRADTTAQIIERTARLEEQIYYLRSTLDRIDTRLQQITEEE
ncbi:hypothetical protein [Aquisalinus flavus]|uniref:Uncharacterized protein n=1 Tax=Aquisalinus flavus TaxID=1526572 RepID=A0A8J2V7J6_9PROT|nr:hypothetical protein [Aquisalinus flavus]MBD0426282.1 hypothetical protein [Aquisalinus flavus]UNE48148.1 hypothetical protein FF099_08845 [Aquisalinus flavus]GGD09188.1 hypothetical protein GCM10011342_17540 [Aquisalinus flavus]